MYDVGTRNSVMNVANSAPKPSDTAIGTMKEASRLLLHISGASPKKVVSDVSRMGREAARGDRGDSAGRPRNPGPESAAGRVTEWPLSDPARLKRVSVSPLRHFHRRLSSGNSKLPLS